MINIYGKLVAPIHNDFAKAYSSGPLDNFEVCEYFLKRKYKKNTYGNVFTKILHKNPFYFKHVELFMPIINPLFVRYKSNVPSILLDIDAASLNEVLEYKKYIVIKDYEGRFSTGSIISYTDFCRIKELGWNTEVDTGASAIQIILSSMDLYSLHSELIGKKTQYYEVGKVVPLKLEKRIKVVEYFLDHYIYPESMIMDTMIVPNVEELINKDIGRVRTDIRTLYSSIVCRNERVKQLCSIACPDVIIQNEARMLQKLVDNLYKKCFKLFGCEDVYKDDLDLSNKLGSMFNFFEETAPFLKICMISLMFNFKLLEVEDESFGFTFTDFLSIHNSTKDAAAWYNVSTELIEQ